MLLLFIFKIARDQKSAYRTLDMTYLQVLKHLSYEARKEWRWYEVLFIYLQFQQYLINNITSNSCIYQLSGTRSTVGVCILMKMLKVAADTNINLMKKLLVKRKKRF